MVLMKKKNYMVVMSFWEFAIETNSSQIEHNLLIAVTDHSNHHIIDY